MLPQEKFNATFWLSDSDFILVFILTFFLTRRDLKLFDIIYLNDISLLAVEFWGVWQKNPPKVRISENTCLKAFSLSQSVRIFWAIVGWNRFMGKGCTRVKKYINKMNNNKRHATRVFHHQVGAQPMIRFLPTLVGFVKRAMLSSLPNFELIDS